MNNIIKFEKNFHKNAVLNQYELKAQILVRICRNDESYKVDFFSPNKISEKDIYEILKKIFSKLKEEIPKLEYKEKEVYNKDIVLLYYEKSPEDFKYICCTPNIPKKKLLEYLFAVIYTKDSKEEGAL